MRHRSACLRIGNIEQGRRDTVDRHLRACEGGWQESGGIKGRGDRWPVPNAALEINSPGATRPARSPPGAQNVLQWIGSPNCPARAAVSLDTTLEYPKGYELNKSLRAALLKLTTPRIPVLLFAQAWLNPQFSAFDIYLNDAAHYEAKAAELSHDDFLTHGYLGLVLMHRPNAELVRRSYEEVCRAIRTFLDASLKDDAKAARSSAQYALSSPVSIRYKPAR